MTFRISVRAPEEQGGRIIGFRIFYDDRTVFSGRSVEDWDKAPKEGVQLVLLYHEQRDDLGNPYRTSVCSWDYYAFDGKVFSAGNDTRVLSGDIKYGRWMITEEWLSLSRDSMEDISLRSTPKEVSEDDTLISDQR